jgi:hypothetical protein
LFVITEFHCSSKQSRMRKFRKGCLNVGAYNALILIHLHCQQHSWEEKIPSFFKNFAKKRYFLLQKFFFWHSERCDIFVLHLLFPIKCNLLIYSSSRYLNKFKKNLAALHFSGLVKLIFFTKSHFIQLSTTKCKNLLAFAMVCS